MIIRSARDIGGDALEEFYREVYPARALSEMWRWLYRASRADNPMPLVMLDGTRVIAHAGGIPFAARLGPRQLRAQWFTDFALLPGYRNRGLGQELARAWMASAELSVTFCNDESMRVFQKLDWTGSREFGVHTLWLRASDHPRLTNAPALAQASADVSWRGAQALTGIFVGSAPTLEPIDQVTLNALREATLGEEARRSRSTRALMPVRDAEYLAWRVGESPRRPLYRLYRGLETTMLVSLGHETPKRLDVLWMAGAASSSHPEVRRMLASLARWARSNGYSSMRYLPSDAELASSLRVLLPLVSRPQFAYWTTDADLRMQLGTSHGHWQLLDSDFEWL